MSKTSIERAAPGIAPDAPLVRRALSGPAMGSRWSAIVHVPASFDVDALGAALAVELEAVEDIASNWRPGSEIERLNRAPLGEWMAISPGLLDLLEAALAIGRLSDGAFDVGVGDLVRAWGFGGGTRRPEPSAIATTAGRPSFDPPRTLALDPLGRRARRLAPLTVDLAGIAKGWGVDRMAWVARRSGVASFLVGIDGELRAAGLKPDGRPWAVGQERPDPDRRDLAGLLELTDAAVATSGSYRHVVEIGGERLSHTFDPATGAPLRGDLAQVTVVAGECMIADAWATALMVAGLDRGLDLARRHGLAAILVATTGETRSTMPGADGSPIRSAGPVRAPA